MGPTFDAMGRTVDALHRGHVRSRFFGTIYVTFEIEEVFHVVFAVTAQAFLRSGFAGAARTFALIAHDVVFLFLVHEETCWATVIAATSCLHLAVNA